MLLLSPLYSFSNVKTHPSIESKIFVLQTNFQEPFDECYICKMKENCFILWLLLGTWAASRNKYDWKKLENKHLLPMWGLGIIFPR